MMMTRQDRAMARAIRLLRESADALKLSVRARRLQEDAGGPPMKIMMHNSGYGTAKKPVQVYNTMLKMDQHGRPQLWFSTEQGGHPDLYAEFTSEGWVADMD